MFKIPKMFIFLNSSISKNLFKFEKEKKNRNENQKTEENRPETRKPTRTCEKT
jgi:hypothetical protein